MKERPILFSAPMVRALLAGTKTQTRRVMTPQPKPWGALGGFELPGFCSSHESSFRHSAPIFASKFGRPGDRLWVRESWRGVVNIAPPGSYEYAVARYVPGQEHCRRVEYAATQAADGEPWRPSIHMPRWASRITLEITGIRIERLQDISEADAIAEGVRSESHVIPDDDTSAFFRTGAVRNNSFPIARYAALWESLNGAGSWSANTWVWVVEFKRVEGGAA